MPQYKTGTVSVTNGSNAVTGNGTAWLANVAAGYLFVVVADGVSYEVEDVSGDGALTLTDTYAGVTGSAKAYVIARDFTTPDNIPWLTKGDIEAPVVLKRMAAAIQTALSGMRLGVTGIYADLAAPLLFAPLKNSLNLVHGAGSLTFTRSTTATYLDRYGVVQSAAVDEPRFESAGLLIEGASTNVLIKASIFDDGAWMKSAASISANTVAAPDGTTTADTLIEDTATAEHYVVQTAIISAGVTTLSIYVKPKERSQVSLTIYNGTDGNAANTSFDLSAGSVISTTSGVASIIALADGWYRCAVTATTTVADSSFVVKLTSGGVANYTGDGASGLYLWGGQAELLPFASSYIPTTTTSVTRNPDICTADYAGNMPGPSADYTVALDFDVLGEADSPAQVAFKVAGETYRFIYGYYAAPDVVAVAAGVSDQLATTTPVVGTTYRVGTSVQAQTIANTYINGDLEDTFTPTVAGGAATGLSLGSWDSSQFFLFGHIANVRIYDQALGAAQMRLL